MQALRIRKALGEFAGKRLSRGEGLGSEVLRVLGNVLSVLGDLGFFVCNLGNPGHIPNNFVELSEVRSETAGSRRNRAWVWGCQNRDRSLGDPVVKV